MEEFCFVYESGSKPAEPFTVDMPVVAELLRITDLLFMPSHREGFGMPVLEAGLAGIPVVCSDSIPSAAEIGGEDVIKFSPAEDADQVTGLILQWVENSPVYRLRRRVKWLYLSEESEEFEETAQDLVERISRADPRIGVLPKPRKSKKGKTRPTTLP